MPETWGFSDLYGFDEELLAMIPQPVVAVVINSERLKKDEDHAKGSADIKASFYMKQSGTLDNACGIIACVHSILNNLVPTNGSD